MDETSGREKENERHKMVESNGTMMEADGHGEGKKTNYRLQTTTLC